MIAASDCVPNFALRRNIPASDLKDVQEPAVLFEHHGFDSDGESYFVYTLGGWLNGENICTMLGGATVGGDVIVIHADDRFTADAMAVMGLEDTINALHTEDERLIDALAAQERLKTVGALDRLELAMKPDSEKPDSFILDQAKLRPLVGDDLILAAGH